jgi:hypothetical protein
VGLPFIYLWTLLQVTKQLAVQVSCSGGAATSTPVFEYDVTIPVGSVAKVVLSAFGGGPKTDVAESGKSVWSAGKFVTGVAGVTGGSTDGKSITLNVGSGRYTFTVAHTK